MADFSSKASALAVILAVEQGDLEKFNQAFRGIDDDSCRLLEKFLVEVATGKYEVFRKEDAPQFHANPNYARSILRAWYRVGSARPRMGARMAFESIISTRR